MQGPFYSPGWTRTNNPSPAQGERGSRSEIFYLNRANGRISPQSRSLQNSAWPACARRSAAGPRGPAGGNLLQGRPRRGSYTPPSLGECVEVDDAACLRIEAEEDADGSAAQVQHGRLRTFVATRPDVEEKLAANVSRASGLAAAWALRESDALAACSDSKRFTSLVNKTRRSAADSPASWAERSAGR